MTSRPWPALAVLVAAGCTQSPRFGSSSSSSSSSGELPIAVAPTCRPLHVDNGSGANGRILSSAVDGGVLVVFQSVSTPDGGPARSALAAMTLPIPAADCLPTTLSDVDIFDPAAGGRAVPLSLVEVAGRTWLYHAWERFDPGAPFGVRLDGYGVAVRDESSGRFSVGNRLLWTADRPAFGSASVVHGGFVYAYGCSGYGFLQAHCSVARAPVASIDDEAAYTYYAGGGHWTPLVDNAWPMVEAGSSVSVSWHPARSRWLMVYARPLDHVLRVRSGLRPEGPWSFEHTLTGCERPAADGNAFCLDVVTHPLLSKGDAVPVTYSVTSFDQTASPDDYRTRLVEVALPPDLP